MNERGAILLAADAAPGVGLGHLSRLSALAAALVAGGLSVRALALGATTPRRRYGINWEPLMHEELAGAVSTGTILVLDSYLLPRDEVASIGETAIVVAFHDLGEPYPASLVIAPMSEDRRRGVLAGLEFVCLGPDYWELPEEPPSAESVRSVLVTTGGTDPGGIGSIVADALATRTEVSLVRGPEALEPVPGRIRAVTGAETLAPELLRADLVVTGGGQTLLEAAACGTPAVTLALAPNQRRAAERLAGAGAALLADPPTGDEALAALEELVHSRELRRRVARRARGLVDGRGALRVADAIARGPA